MSLGFSFPSPFSAFFASSSPSFPLIQGTHKASYFQWIDLRAPASFPALRSQVSAWTFSCLERYPGFAPHTQLSQENCSGFSGPECFSLSFLMWGVWLLIYLLPLFISSFPPQGMDLSGRWPSRFLPPDFWFPAFLPVWLVPACVTICISPILLKNISAWKDTKELYCMLVVLHRLKASFMNSTGMHFKDDGIPKASTTFWYWNCQYKVLCGGILLLSSFSSGKYLHRVLLAADYTTGNYQKWPRSPN